MTLILTCLTNDYIVQVSDRRLTYKDGEKVVIADNDSNKALVYKNRFLFAYTGLAKLPIQKHRQDTQSAIDWAAQLLSESKNLEDGVHLLKYRLTELMNSNRIRKLHEPKRRLAFIGAGFEEVESGDQTMRIPLRILIENFIEDDGIFLNQPRDDFRIHCDKLKNCEAALYDLGQTLPKKRKFQLTRFIRQCVRHNVRPETIGVHLTREIQAMATRYETVGNNIMCTFVPRTYSDKMGPHSGGIQLQMPVLNTEPQQLTPAEDIPLEERIVILPPFDSPRYMYVDGNNKALPYYSPLYVYQGVVVPTIIMSDIVTTIPPFIRVPHP